MLQHKAADGSLLNEPHDYEGTWDKKFPLMSKVNGYVGFDIETGKVLVITSPKSPTRKIRVGKFLKRTGLSLAERETESKSASNLFKIGKVELKFTSTSEEVVDVYHRGSYSCMKDCDSVAVYATEDVCVAYLLYEGDVLARAVVSRTEGLRYYRIYGEEELMKCKLKDAGAKLDMYYLDGAKLLHLTDDMDDLMMPYLDGACSDISEPDGDEFVVVTSKGDITCDCTNGRPTTTVCTHCDFSIPRSEVFYSEYYEDACYCEDCYLENHVEVDGTYYHIEDETIVETENDGWYLREDVTYVKERSEWHLTNDCIYNNYTEEYILRSDLDL